jgi:hypothetical protein
MKSFKWLGKDDDFEKHFEKRLMEEFTKSWQDKVDKEIYKTLYEGDWTATEARTHNHSQVLELQNQLLELHNKLHRIQLEQNEEELIRKVNPTVNDAWEQYQIALKLVQK